MTRRREGESHVVHRRHWSPPCTVAGLVVGASTCGWSVTPAFNTAGRREPFATTVIPAATDYAAATELMGEERAATVERTTFFFFNPVPLRRHSFRGTRVAFSSASHTEEPVQWLLVPRLPLVLVSSTQVYHVHYLRRHQSYIFTYQTYNSLSRILVTFRRTHHVKRLNSLGIKFF